MVRRRTAGRTPVTGGGGARRRPRARSTRPVEAALPVVGLALAVGLAVLFSAVRHTEEEARATLQASAALRTSVHEARDTVEDALDGDGDQAVAARRAEVLFGEAEELCVALRDGGPSRYGTVRSVDDPGHGRLCDELADVRRLSLRDLEARAAGYRGSDEDAELDRVVGDLMAHLDEDAEAMRARFARDARALASLEWGIVGLVVALFAGLAAVLRLARRAGESRAAERSRLAAIVEASGDAIFSTTPAGDVLTWNAGAERLFGYRAEEVLGRPASVLVAPARAEEDGALRRAAMAGERVAHQETERRARDGRAVEVSLAVSPVRDAGGRVEALAVVARDVGERKRADRAHQEELLRQALHDPLTGLGNRVLLRDHVEHALARSARHPAVQALIFLDLDGFKTVNDSLGHGTGDRVLRVVADRLQEVVRAHDTVARVGGDEFAVLLEDTDPEEASRVAGRLLDALRRPVAVGGTEVVVTASVGVATTDHGQDAEGLVRDADVAMYVAKAEGKSRHRLFVPEMGEAARRRLELESDLRLALDRGELAVVYQPIVDLGGGAVGGSEALLRWHHPRLGLIPPVEFIPVAEDTGLIHGIGLWVLEEACRQTAAWSRDHRHGAPLRVSVNVSARQFESPRFADDVASCLERTGLDPRWLTLEITESLFLGRTEGVVATLDGLRARGIEIAIDDFGTGYSSLGYLKSLPVDTLKIDRSFVARVTEGTEQSAVTQAVMRLARTFALRTVAEGIETAGQAAHLAGLGCDMGQGYYFARPLAAEDMARALRSGLPAAVASPPR
ncbi:MAG TPA: EAL domain-containing protein [Acidimicrobiales bacterium]|nr:EAL domain-containing protein [Acidimicrobiales bacterium]